MFEVSFGQLDCDEMYPVGFERGNSEVDYAYRNSRRRPSRRMNRPRRPFYGFGDDLDDFMDSQRWTPRPPDTTPAPTTQQKRPADQDAWNAPSSKKDKKN